VPYTNVALPQAAYAITNVPQPSTAIPRNVSEPATTNPPSTVKINDTSRKCWTCISEQHFSSRCPNKIHSTTNPTQASNKNNDPDLNDPNEPCKYCKMTGHTVKHCYKLAKQKLAEDAEKLKTDSLQPSITIARVVSSVEPST